MPELRDRRRRQRVHRRHSAPASGRGRPRDPGPATRSRCSNGPVCRGPATPASTRPATTSCSSSTTTRSHRGVGRRPTSPPTCATRRSTAVGGPVVLGWPDGRPTWAIPRLYHWWSALDLGDEPPPFPGPMARTARTCRCAETVLDAVGGFPAVTRPSGRRPAVWRGGRVLGSCVGGRRLIRYEPATLVVHEVVPDKVSRWWILRRGVAQGRTNARLAALAAAPAPRAARGCRDDARFAARRPPVGRPRRLSTDRPPRATSWTNWRAGPVMLRAMPSTSACGCSTRCTSAGGERRSSPGRRRGARPRARRPVSHARRGDRPVTARPVRARIAARRAATSGAGERAVQRPRCRVGARLPTSRRPTRRRRPAASGAPRRRCRARPTPRPPGTAPSVADDRAPDGSDEEAVVVVHELEVARVPGRDHRHAREHRLGHRVAEPLGTVERDIAVAPLAIRAPISRRRRARHR